MTVELIPALAAGALAGMLMTAMRLLLRGLGVPIRLDILRLWGDMLGVGPRLARLVGLVVHVAGSAAIGLIYAYAFALLAVRQLDLAWGLLGGAIHWLGAGFFMAWLPALEPELRGSDRPGAFALRQGATDVVVFVLGHLMYGVAFVVVYPLLRGY